jgi:K+-sensing histidine kinase KdpD
MPYREILENINKAATKLLLPLTPEETYITIVNEAVELVGAEFGSILLDQGDGNLVRVYGSAPFTYNIRNRKRGNTYRAFKTRKTIVASVKEIGKYHPQLVENSIKSTVFIPLSYENKSLGVLTVNSRKEVTLSDGDRYVLELLGTLASLAIRKVRLYNEVQSALKARDLFISMASHELKTPLTSINGYVQLLQKKLEGQENSEGRWIQHLSFETNRLIRLVDELLQTNSLKAGKLQFVWKVCSLREIIRRAVDTFSFSYPNSIIFVEDKIDGPSDNIIGDNNKLLQVFSNLIDNAAKSSSVEKPVLIRMFHQKPFFVIEVIDQGKGIAEKDLPLIFNEFHKNEGETTEGMGLGLYLVKKIITEHRGSIEVKSQERKGTNMIVKLPELKL